MSGLFGLLGLLLALAAPAAADDGEAPPAPLPRGVVARAGGKTLTFDRFCDAAAQNMIPRLRSPGSHALTILRQMVQETVVIQACERLGITVTEAEVNRRLKEYAAEVRQRSGGNKTLEDLMRENHTPLAEFRDRLRDQIRKDKVASHQKYLGRTLAKEPNARIAQIEVVIKKLMDQAKVAYGVPTATQPEPTPMDPRWVATVQGDPGRTPAPLTRRAYGEQLVLRLSSGDVRGILDQECKAALMASEELRLTEAQLDEEIAIHRRIWDLERELASQDAWANVPYEEYVAATHKMPLEDLRKNRYFRGYFGLLRKFRSRTATPDSEVVADYEQKKDGVWGPYVLVTDVQIRFVQDKSPFAPRNARREREALQMGREVGRKMAAGIPFSQIVKEINARQDRTYKANRRRLRNTDEDRQLYDLAKSMKDGDLSSPLATLSEVHVIRRESAHAAPSYQKVAPLVREAIARRKARNWLEERVRDPKLVQVRWPLPERTGEE